MLQSAFFLLHGTSVRPPPHGSHRLHRQRRFSELRRRYLQPRYGGGNTGNPSTTPSGNQSGPEPFTAEDLLSFSNSGNSDKIIQLVSATPSGEVSEQTSTIVLAAADLGLPANGTVTLTITGAVQYNETVSADADGNVTFVVPMVETEKFVTVELTVQDANGFVLYSGSTTQQVNGTGNLQVSLDRQYWTLTPGCIAISATSYSLLYNTATWNTENTMLSVTGLDAAPAGSSFSYEWKDESGAVICTDPTLTQTAYELLNGTAPAGDVTRTFTVTVSYTDASGAAVTADASAEIAIGGPVTIPAFSIRMTAPDSRDMTVSTTAWALTSLTDGIRFTPDAGTDGFPAGTVFDWEIEATGGSLITRRTAVGTDCVVSPDDLSLDESNMGTQAAPTTITVSCTAKNDRAAVDVDAAPNSVTQDVYLLYTIPAFTINITPPPASSYAEAKSDAAAAKYALKNLTGAFSFTPVPAAGSFPTGTTFEWTVESGSLSCTPAATGIGTAATAALSGSPGLGLTDATIGRTTGTATAVTVKCTAKNTYAADKDAPDKSMSAFLLQTMPAFTIRIDPPASYNAGNSSVALNKYALTSLEDGFTLTAIPNAPATGFPEDTTFSWSYGSSTVVDPVTGTAVTGTSCTITPAMLGVSSTSPGTKTSPKSKLLSCSASSPNTAEDQLAPNKTLQAFLLTIPNITVTLSTPPAGLTTNSSGAYPIKTADLTTKNFEFTASPVAGSTMPDGVKYAWTIGTTALNTASTSDQTITRTLDDLGITALPASQQTLTVKCTVSHDSLAAGTEKYNTVNVKIAPAAVKMKTGSGIKAVLHALGANSGSGKTFSASATAPAEGTSTQLLSDTGSEVEVLAWLDADGTSIKYYAADYTDSSRKIPLNAESNGMFFNCSGLTSLDVSGFDTSNVTNMNDMFEKCSGLTSLDVSGFNTSKVTSMGAMFYGCTGLTSLDVSSFDTSKVTNMGSMFEKCSGLTCITGLSGFDTRNVTDMGSMFHSCSGLTSLDVSSFNTSKITSMYEVFSGCSSLTSLDVSSFDTSKVTNMFLMFCSCSSLTSITGLNRFNTSKVTSMSTMFQACSNLTVLDLSSFNTGNVAIMEAMFLSCSKLTTIYVSDRFVTTNVTDSNRMFEYCAALKGGGTPQTAYNSSYTDKTRARIDGGSTSSTPGYFTAAP